MKKIANGVRTRLELANFHMIAGRHHEIGGPRDFLTESIENRSRRLGNAIVAVALARQTGKIGADAVVPVREAPGDESALFQRAQDSQQTRFGYTRLLMDVVQ